MWCAGVVVGLAARLCSAVPASKQATKMGKQHTRRIGEVVRATDTISVSVCVSLSNQVIDRFVCMNAETYKKYDRSNWPKRNNKGVTHHPP